MIDLEPLIYTTCYEALIKEYPECDITSEYVSSPSGMPHVSIVEKDNAVWRNTSDEITENHVALTYEVNVYSNQTTGKKSEAKAIFTVVDKAMENLGLRRTTLNESPNLYDTSIYRLTARYRCVANNEYIYRR